MNDSDPNATLALLSAALDEVYRLRHALAFEARVVEAQTLSLSDRALGKNRRAIVEAQVDRMRAAVRSPLIAYAGISWASMERELRELGDDLTLLTVETWRRSLEALRQSEATS